VTNPAKTDPEGMLLFFFYQDRTYGRIVVKEQANQLKQSDLENLLDNNSQPTSEAVFSLVKLDGGTEALVETLKTPSKDVAANSVELIAGDADITIFGPDGTFTSDPGHPSGEPCRAEGLSCRGPRGAHRDASSKTHGRGAIAIPPVR
jgi:hypothetical protein